VTAICDACAAPLGPEPGRCGVALADAKVVLSFNLCGRCQVGFLVGLNEFLAYHPPERLAA